MERVLVECDRAAAGFDTDPVHDLRVALRRCRSLADGMIAIDPDASWKEMKKAGRKLFQALGELRDMQVMQEWIEKLSGLDHLTADRFSAADPSPRDLSLSDVRDPVVVKLFDHIHARETECKQLAFKDLNQFDRKQWRQWSKSLPQRTARVRPGSAVYLHLGLEKWTAAYDLHKHALRTRSRVSLHALRIGIKRFRYTVENFLPRQHALWGSDLKELQDLLGEVHDLDVLLATALEIHAFPDAASRDRWRQKLNGERAKRIDRYREMMVGKDSLWRVWRAELPAGEALRAAAVNRLRVWAGYLDPDFQHSERVERLALLLYDGLLNAGLLGAVHSADGGAAKHRSANHRSANHPANGRLDSASTSGADRDPRAILQAAALMHDVGKFKNDQNHHKASYRMIRGLARPLGWSARELELAAVVARYHRGALPHPRGKTVQLLDLPDRRLAMELAGVLRLANALDMQHRQNRHHHYHYAEIAPRLEVSDKDRSIVVRVPGYSPLDRSAQDVAAARHLIETVLRRPVLVKALRTQGSNGSARRPPQPANG
jgi:CHAD domain-containing protein